MEKEFVPKKTITVQLPLEVMQKFCELCKAYGLPKTKAIEKMIGEAHDALFAK